MDFKAKKQQEENYYDRHGGFIFMKNWPPIIKWICLLPAVIAILFIMMIFFSGILHRNEYENSYYLAFLYEVSFGFPFLCAVRMAAAIAPKKRILTSIITATIFAIFGVYAALTQFYAIYKFELSDNSFILLIGIHYLSFFGCLYWGVRMVKKKMKKIVAMSDHNNDIAQ